MRFLQKWHILKSIQLLKTAFQQKIIHKWLKSIIRSFLKFNGTCFYLFLLVFTFFIPWENPSKM